VAVKFVPPDALQETLVLLSLFFLLFVLVLVGLDDASALLQVFAFVVELVLGLLEFFLSFFQKDAA